METGHRFIVPSNRLEKSGIEPAPNIHLSKTQYMQRNLILHVLIILNTTSPMFLATLHEVSLLYLHMIANFVKYIVIIYFQVLSVFLCITQQQKANKLQVIMFT